MAGRHSAGHVAALVAHMPQSESMLYQAMDEDAGWSRTDILLALVVNHLSMLRYGFADPKTRGPVPQTVGPSWMQPPKRSLDARVMRIDELMEVLSRPRVG